MCNQYKEHIHMSNVDGISYSTSCTECFSNMLENPEILAELQNEDMSEVL